MKRRFDEARCSYGIVDLAPAGPCSDSGSEDRFKGCRVDGAHKRLVGGR